MEPEHEKIKDLIAETKIKQALKIKPDDVYAKDFRFAEVALKGARVALQNLGPFRENTTPALMLLMKDEDERVRWLVNELLREIGPSAKDAIPLLIEALKDQYGYVRGSAAVALGQIRQGTSQVISALIESLQDSDSFVRNAAVMSLRGFVPPAKIALPALNRIQNHDPDYRVRETARKTIALISSDNWQIHLEEAVRLFHFGQIADAQSESDLTMQLARKAASQLGEALSFIDLGRCKPRVDNL
ncbi:MAG: HEAT repeat domain-containing protein [Caldilineaceae bacterium]